ESKELAEKVKIGKLMPADQEGNTFTISNVGMYGITTFTPKIKLHLNLILIHKKDFYHLLYMDTYLRYH
ncbi:2-oxo acid dehydrogenase subunit E2, partial [Clostridioides difficile]|nr:2-oxo acid dehydrogenase subunit E2 [Clostridioides difficile]